MKNHPIYQWPAWFLENLSPSEQKLLTPELIAKLGDANIYLWLAYNAYDDVIDNNKNIQKLPVANNFHRRFLEIYYRLNLDSHFYNLFNKVLDDLELANQQEILQNRINVRDGKIVFPSVWPNFLTLTDLSRKSLALAFGPIAMLEIGVKANKIEKIGNVLSFFRFALAAKQLADDAKDWFEDLKNGSITAVNIYILKKAQKEKIILDFKRHPETIYSLFITEAVEPTYKGLKSLCNQARTTAKLAGLKPGCRLVESILCPLEANLDKAADARSFCLKKYPGML